MTDEGLAAMDAAIADAISTGRTDTVKFTFRPAGLSTPLNIVARFTATVAANGDLRTIVCAVWRDVGELEK